MSKYSLSINFSQEALQTTREAGQKLAAAKGDVTTSPFESNWENKYYSSTQKPPEMEELFDYVYEYKYGFPPHMRPILKFDESSRTIIVQ